MAENTFGFHDALNQAATVRSTAARADGSRLSFAVRSSGTATGSWSVQYSNDFSPTLDDPTVDTKWDTYTLTSNPPDAAGSNQVFGVAIDNFEFTWARLKFTRTGGSGTADVFTEVKGT
jgi:hypothetical protein